MKLNKHNLVALIGCVITSLVIFLAVFGPMLATADPNVKVLDQRLMSPMTDDHLLGTDNMGRDVLSRILWGARTSVWVAVSSVLISGLVGTLLGLLAGYYGGWIDHGISRLVELQMSFPTIVLALIIATLAKPGILTITLVLIVTGWVVHARLVRGAVIALKNEEFIQAAKAIGASDARILCRYLIPNILSIISITATLEIGKRIILEATLSFLGVGLQPPDISWGLILFEGQSYISSAWWLSVFPGMALAVTVFGINLLGDWLRDQLDPKSIS